MDINSTAVNTVSPSPKEVVIQSSVLAELKEKPTPEEIVERIKGKVLQQNQPYPEEDINPDDIPF